MYEHLTFVPNSCYELGEGEDGQPGKAVLLQEMPMDAKLTRVPPPAETRGGGHPSFLKRELLFERDTHYLRTKGRSKAILTIELLEPTAPTKSRSFKTGSPSDVGSAIPKGLNSPSLWLQWPEKVEKSLDGSFPIHWSAVDTGHLKSQPVPVGRTGSQH